MRMDLTEMRQSLPPEFTATEARDLLSQHYRAPLKLLGELERAGTLLRLKRGLYTLAQGFEPLAAAAAIHAPSYVSFETALAHYGMLPETVPTIMSVVDGRPATFETPLARYEYVSQARALYAAGMTLGHLGDRRFPVATREKALLDTLARANLKTVALPDNEVLDFVVEGLRIDPDALAPLSLPSLRRLAAMYRNLGPQKLVRALAAQKRAP